MVQGKRVEGRGEGWGRGGGQRGGVGEQGLREMHRQRAVPSEGMQMGGEV